MTEKPDPMALPGFLSGTGSAGLGPVDWVPLARDIAKRGGRAVLIFIVEATGSAPRGEGTWLLVTDETTFGTLGGGELERLAALEARALIGGEGVWQRALTRRILGPDLGQCCGGRVSYVFEPVDAGAAGWLADVAAGLEETGAGNLSLSLVDPSVPPAFAPGAAEPVPLPRGKAIPDALVLPLLDPRPHLVIFGAGHVGRTFAAFAASLPLRVHVVDDRPAALEAVTRTGNVIPVLATDPVDYVASPARIDAAFVMTYSHELDFAISRALLTRDDTGYVGMIGSKSKAARARKQILEAGLERQLPRFVSPIGADGPPGKEPGVIALGALSEVLRVLRQPDQAGETAAPVL